MLKWLLFLSIIFFSFIQCSQSTDETHQITKPPTSKFLQLTTKDHMPTIQPVRVPLPANETFTRVAKEAMASVVNISSTRKREKSTQRNPFPFFDDPFFRKFFKDEFGRQFREPQPRQEEGLGSGVIVSADGYIVTNNHVIEQADELTVLLGNKDKFPAKLIGTDPKTDLAIIKIDGNNLPTLRLGNSQALQVGELVLAVGNPFGLNQTVTMGIISAIGRANMGIVDYEDFIQTDAAINPGNSGGALVNLSGELIGINTAIFSRTGGYMGIGFAIPTHMVKNVMKNLIDHGKVIRGWIGVSIQELTTELAEQFNAPDTAGALVGNVVKASPAYKAGMERGDIIRRFNGTKVKSPIHLRTLVAETTPGKTVTLNILRNKQSKKLSLTIKELPKNLAAIPHSDVQAQTNHVLSGIKIESLPFDGKQKEEGVLISQVNPNSEAATAGLRKGDIILEINRTAVKNIDDFNRLTRDLGESDPVLILLKRGNGVFYLSIKP